MVPGPLKAFALALEVRYHLSASTCGKGVRRIRGKRVGVFTKEQTAMLSHALRRCAGVLLVGAVLGLLAYKAQAEGPSSGWLNVRDCGASGSEFTTTAATTAGSNQIVVKDAGDFKVGQEVMVSRCNPRLCDDHLWGPKIQYTAGSGRKLKDIVDLRGYDETSGSWTAYILDVERATPPVFRWSEDIGRTWKTKVPITYDWQPLKGGLEVRFHQYDWAQGYTASFIARDQLVSVIEKIEGNVLTLKDAATRSTKDAVVRHSDTAALQAAIDRGLKEKLNVFVPNGWYRLTKGLSVRDPQGITLQGESGELTVLDISEGTGACINMSSGVEANVRNFRMIGGSGFAERDQCGSIGMHGCGYLWGQDLKTSFATAVVGTERVLVENCHARRMSLEAFWSGGPSRSGLKEPKQYTKAITYLRCSAVDCGRNGFNNNDLAENTSILYCRIVDVGGCAWEGASRFVKFVGNYVRNSGTVAIGNVSTRGEDIEVLPSGQHIVRDNVFESNVPYGGCAIRTASGSSPVVIADNLFINFNSSAIELCGVVSPGYGLPASDSTVTGNIFDMTCVDPKPKPRIAIQSSQSGVIIADNQIYVRGAADANVTALSLREPALNVTVHDNLICNCGSGIASSRGFSRVGEVVDQRTFVAGNGTVPLEKRRSHRYAGWNLVWMAGGKPPGVSVIDSYEVEPYRFHLREPRDMKVGDTYEVYPPYGANWNIHSNTITGCLKPVVLDSYGSETCLFKNNVISRGDATGVKAAVEVHGRFDLIGNHLSGFDEKDSSALALFADRIRRSYRNIYRDNVFERCANLVAEDHAGLYKAADAGGNLVVGQPSKPSEEKKE